MLNSESSCLCLCGNFLCPDCRDQLTSPNPSLILPIFVYPEASPWVLADCPPGGGRATPVSIPIVFLTLYNFNYKINKFKLC